ncbi:MAG: CapA family protein [Syntrophomonadaceae bacterium]|nr:CapA family protein [Syntrophomonadaceae bacterium]
MPIKKILIGTIFLALIVGMAWSYQGESETLPPEIPVEEPSLEVSLLAVGDVMLARKVERLTQANGDTYPFIKISSHLKEADLTFGNLESPLSDRGTPLPGKGIQFRARPQLAQTLQESGFNVLSVANNHSLDYDAPAFLDTIELLRGAGVLTAGGGQDLTEARQPVIIEKNGLKVGILAYTDFADIFFDYSYRRSFEATDERSGVAPLREEMILADLEELRPYVDVAIVSLHWGTEYSPVPDKSQQVLGRALLDGGADLIIGHHPHIIQGFEKYKNGLIAYSLGNFIFDQNQHVYTREGLILEVSLNPEGLGEIQVRPVFIDESQPYLLEGQAAQKILENVQNQTRRLGTESTINGDYLAL